MNSLKWIWTFFVLLSCWILPFLEAGRKKRQFASFTTKKLEILTNETSNHQEFESVLDPMLIERVSGTTGNVAVQEFIENHMINLGWNVTKDSFTDNTPFGPKPFTNIIATLDPRAPTRLVLACHFDSKYMDRIKFLAATDSAVPCAILIHLAQKLFCTFQKTLHQPEAPQTTVQLLFLDGEEAFVHWSSTDSTYGARHLANLWHTTPDPHDSSKNMLDTITDFVLLDLIGTNDVSFKNMFEETSDLYDKLYRIEKKLNERHLLFPDDNDFYRPYFGNHPVRRMGIEDDHIPFLHRGVNILHLISVPFPRVWHNANDNKSNLDFRAIDNFNRIFRVFVASYLRLDVTRNTCRRK